MASDRRTRIYHAVKPGCYRTGMNAGTSAKHVDLKKITAKKLFKHYLCDGERSLCVVKRQCECLDACKFGQRYIELTEKMQ